MPMSGDGPSRRFDVVAETRRRWSTAEKKAIVAEASVPCTNVSTIARRHGISPSLLFRWIKVHKAEHGQEVCPAEAKFLPVALPAPAVAEMPATDRRRTEQGRKPPRASAPSDTIRIEIELANGRVRVGAGVDAALLKQVIDVLEA